VQVQAQGPGKEPGRRLGREPGRGTARGQALELERVPGVLTRGPERAQERDKAQVPARELEAEGRPQGQALERGPGKVQALERQRALERDTAQMLCREGPAAESRIDGASSRR
jgi:hypothetical protein